MKTIRIFLCCLLCMASVLTFARPRDYAYVLEEPKWQEERMNALLELKTAWTHIKVPHCCYQFPDSILLDTIVQNSHIVNEGELHRIAYVQNGGSTHEYYYKDKNKTILHVMGGVYANNGQPYSFDEYYYISRDGLITFNTRKYIEMLLWCANVYLSPLLWLAVLIFLIDKGVHKLLVATTIRKLKNH